MILTKKDVVLDKIVYDEGLAKVIKVEMGKGNGKRNYVIVYVHHLRYHHGQWRIMTRCSERQESVKT